MKASLSDEKMEKLDELFDVLIENASHFWKVDMACHSALRTGELHDVRWNHERRRSALSEESQFLTFCVAWGRLVAELRTQGRQILRRKFEWINCSGNGSMPTAVATGFTFSRFSVTIKGDTSDKSRGLWPGSRMLGRIEVAFHQSSKRIVRRYLEPADRLQEVLCGLIMVLEFTLIGGLTLSTEKQGVRILLIGAIGCNIAWGIIDGALYAMGNLTARRERLRLLSNLRNAPDEHTAFSILSGKIDPLLEPATSTEDRARICHTLLPVMSRIQLPEGGIVKDDVIGMIAVFLLNLVSVVPAIIPFLIISPPHRALRVSNTLLIATLFAAGFMWGKYIHVNRYVTAGCAVLIGLALVGVAIALGG